MKALLKKSAILKTISSKISTYLHAIDADPQEDDSDFDDEEWMECPTKPTLAHIVLDLLLSPTYRLPKTVTAVRIYRDENIFSVCPRCDVCIEREYQGYCHRCGQYLDWSKLEEAEEIFIGWSGVEDHDSSLTTVLLSAYRLLFFFEQLEWRGLHAICRLSRLLSFFRVLSSYLFRGSPPRSLFISLLSKSSGETR